MIITVTCKCWGVVACPDRTR